MTHLLMGTRDKFTLGILTLYCYFSFPLRFLLFSLELGSGANSSTIFCVPGDTKYIRDLLSKTAECREGLLKRAQQECC